MSTKEKLIELLEKNGEQYISGSAIAENLGITRAAIWKNIRQLEKEGYQIEAITNKGYRLDPLNDAVSAVSLSEALADPGAPFTLEVCSSVSSTNAVLKEKAASLPDWYVLAAGRQTLGKGRSGRSFFSPSDTGIYISILLRPDIPVSDAGKLTTAAAVAACRAIETCTQAKAEIKWVNDVFVNGKKVCGILTEASVNFETGKPDWIVTGIGFNVYEPEEGFPEEIRRVAGAISKERQKNLRVRLAAAFLKEFFALCRDLSGGALYREYKERCFILGKKIDILQGEKRIPAFAEDLTESFSLSVLYEDGTRGELNAGEVSIRPGAESNI